MSQTVQRAIDVIEALSEGPLSGSDVAARLNVSKSTSSRLLQTLVENGFARRAEDGRWVVGNRLISISERALRSFDLRQVAAAHLRRLEELSGHTVHLAQLVGDEVIYLDKVEGRDSVQMYSRVGKRVEIHASGIGKAILANLEDPLREQMMSRLTLSRFSPTTITDRAALRQELELIRTRGWASDDGEFEELINCIAAPITGADGKVRAGVSVTTLKVVASLDKLEGLIPELLRTAEAISRDSGWK